MTSPFDRTRMAPRDRFAGAEQAFRLADEFANLPAQSTPRQGHMQKALYRHGPVTTAIFEFQKDGHINQHAIEGESILHVLEGRVIVHTPTAEYDLGPNDLLLIDPAVPHDIRAAERSRLLMTVVLLGS